MTISQWLQFVTKQLNDSGISSARLDSLLLLEDTLKIDRATLLAHDETKITTSNLLELNTKITQRISRIPLAYIRNTQEFYGRHFYVDSHVLIPRPESESIINLLLELKTSTQKHNVILDIGTGSGILAITTKLELPTTTVIATDINPEALKVASDNAHRYTADITLIEADLLNIRSSFRFDIILANLPYVPDGLITSNEITYEPQSALFSGIDGLSHYQSLWKQVNSQKNKPLAILTESLEQQHSDLIKFASDAGYRLEKTEGLAQLFVLESNNI